MARSTKTAPKSPAKSPAKTAPKAAPKAVETAASGPRAETVEFANEVVRLRDVERLPWALVAERLGLPYGPNGNSRLRRAYAIGDGATNGVRRDANLAAARLVAEENAKAARSAARKSKRAGSSGSSGSSPSERRRARNVEAAKSAPKTSGRATSVGARKAAKS